jgi:hypothetical protein
VVALVEQEDLRLVLQAAERGGVNDAVAIALEDAAPVAGRLLVEPPARLGRIGSVRR